MKGDTINAASAARREAGNRLSAEEARAAEEHVKAEGEHTMAECAEKSAQEWAAKSVYRPDIGILNGPQPGPGEVDRLAGLPKLPPRFNSPIPDQWHDSLLESGWEYCETMDAHFYRKAKTRRTPGQPG